MSLFNTQGRGEREEQQQQSCLMGKTFFLVSKCGRLFQALATWGHSSFLGPRLMRESNRSGVGSEESWLVTRTTYIPLTLAKLWHWWRRWRGVYTRCQHCSSLSRWHTLSSLACWPSYNDRALPALTSVQLTTGPPSIFG